MKVTEVWYSKDIKVSADYQSVGCTIGMKAVVNPGETSSEAFDKLVKRVDRAADARLLSLKRDLHNL